MIIRWFVLPAMVLAGGLLIVSNLVLQTKTVRGWFEQKLARKSGLEWTIGYLSWTPWTGFQISEVKAELRNLELQGARPLYEVDDIDVQIQWTQVLKGSLGVREIRLKSGRVAIPVELMTLLSKPKEKAESSAPEEVPSPPGVKPGPKPGAKKPGPKDPGRKPGGKGPDGKTPSAEGTKESPPERPPARSAVKLLIENCEVTLYSITGGGTGVTLKNLNAELPLAGEDAEGWVAADGLAVGGNSTTEALRMKVAWRRPFLMLPTTTMEWAGLEVQAVGWVRTWGTPRFRAELKVPAAPLETTPVPGWSGLELTAGKVELLGHFAGIVADLHSWQGSAVVEASDLQFGQKVRGDHLTFERGIVTTVMRGGTVQIVDARLLSERLSFLGNAIAVPDGRVRGVMRVVADREHAAAITRMAVGSLISGGWTRSWFEPLVTPDRQYRDLHLEGTLNKAMIDVGRKGEEIEVNEAWNRMVAFVKNEVEETERGIIPTRPREEFVPQ
ncbi:MAG: hypothetical protein VCA35_12470 [Roseibacillus sp.]